MSQSVLPIDAVITWVDGADPAHKAKLDLYFGRSQHERPVGANASRFHDSGEINYCVASLLKFAPWLRTIFILTDAQTPELMELIADTPYANKIKLVDHRDIFAGYEEYLPTFNTRSITTMLWRIPGIAENFLYLNDDFILIQPIQPEDFFRENKIVLRGEWKRLAENDLGKKILVFFRKIRGHSVINPNKRASYSMAMEIAAKTVGFNKRCFNLPHNPHPFKRSILANFYQKNSGFLRKNASFKLRSTEQFVSESLMAHLAIKQNLAIFDNRSKTLLIKPGEQSSTKIRYKLLSADRNQEYKFACIQTLENASYENYTQIIKWLDQRIEKLS